MKAIDEGQTGSRNFELSIVAAILDHAAARHPPLSFDIVTAPFMEMLHAGSSEILREIKALADSMPADSDEEMLGSDSVTGTGVAMADPGSSSSGGSSNEEMPDAFSEGSDAEWGKSSMGRRRIESERHQLARKA